MLNHFNNNRMADQRSSNIMVEMLHNFLSEQNRQQFREIAKQEGLDYETLCARYIKPRSHFHEELNKLARRSRPENTYVAPK